MIYTAAEFLEAAKIALRNAEWFAAGSWSRKQALASARRNIACAYAAAKRN